MAVDALCHSFVTASLRCLSSSWAILLIDWRELQITLERMYGWTPHRWRVQHVPIKKGWAKMDTIKAIACRAGLMSFLAALSALLESVRMVVRHPGREEASRSWERNFLIWLNFVLILGILIWRAT